MNDSTWGDVMEPRRTKSEAERLRNRWAILALVLVVGATGAAGCRHRRSAYRPVFLEPTPVTTIQAEPCDSPPCEPALAPSESLTPAPAFRDDFGGSSDQIIINEAPSSASPPALPPPADEPELQPAPKDEKAVPSSVEKSDGRLPADAPSISPPQASRSPGRAIPTRMTPRSRNTSLLELVQQRTDDPIDLAQPPGNERTWKYIIVHHSGSPKGGYSQLDRVHRDQAGLSGCGYHFVIGNGTDTPDGTIEVTRRWSEQKFSQHCRDAAHPAINEDGISICLIGDFNQQKPTPRQIESARLLIAYLQQKYGISATRVGSHADVSSTNGSACPGRNLSRELLMPTPALTRR